MPTLFFNAGGVDFDDLFEPDAAGVTIPGFYQADGVTLLRYANVANGSKIADVAHFHGDGPDVTNYWAGKGTVINVPNDIGPGTLSAYYSHNTSGATQCSFTMNRNGTWSAFSGTWQTDGFDYPTPPTDNVSGVWYPGGTSIIGDDYDVQFEDAYHSGYTFWDEAVSNGAPAPGWYRLDTFRNITVTVSGYPNSQVYEHRVIIRIRRRSTGVVVSTSYMYFIHALAYV